MKVITIKDESDFTELLLDGLARQRQSARELAGKECGPDLQAQADRFKEMIDGIFAELEAQDDNARVVVEKETDDLSGGRP